MNTPDVGPSLPSIPGSAIKYLIIAAVVAVLSTSAIFTIPAGTRGVLLRFGAVEQGSLAPGLHFKLPFIESYETLSVRVQKAQTTETAASQDLQIVTSKVAVNFNLDPKGIVAVYSRIGSVEAMYQRIISPAVSNAVKAVTAEYNADDLLKKRELVRAEIAKDIRQAVSPYNVVVDAVNITNFNFSADYNKAIERKQVAQQQALQAKYDLQSAQIAAQKQVAIAKAQAEAQIAKAKGNAQATILNAQADAKAMELKAKAITPQILELQALQTWNGNMPQVLGGSMSGFLKTLDVGKYVAKHK
jgi:regulator of protease activity HflC (stomatin/prohibitin superfamily)